jgi:hypothetical protein
MQEIALSIGLCVQSARKKKGQLLLVSSAKQHMKRVLLCHPVPKKVLDCIRQGQCNETMNTPQL